MKMNPVVHFEMPAEDSNRMSEFYKNVFGWQCHATGPEYGNYITVSTTELDENRMPKRVGTINGGFYQKNADNSAPHPSIVIAVDDINEHVKKVQEAGGKVLFEPMNIPNIGLFTSFIDTEGNRVSMLQPSPMM